MDGSNCCLFKIIYSTFMLKQPFGKILSIFYVSENFLSPVWGLNGLTYESLELNSLFISEPEASLELPPTYLGTIKLPFGAVKV